jgi:hypothetical protein
MSEERHMKAAIPRADCGAMTSGLRQDARFGGSDTGRPLPAEGGGEPAALSSSCRIRRRSQRRVAPSHSDSRPALRQRRGQELACPRRLEEPARAGDPPATLHDRGDNLVDRCGIWGAGRLARSRDDVAALLAERTTAGNWVVSFQLPSERHDDRPPVGEIPTPPCPGDVAERTRRLDDVFAAARGSARRMSPSATGDGPEVIAASERR